MSYGGFDEKSSEVGKAVFPVGIIENVELKEIVYNSDDKLSIDVTFVEPGGAEIRMRKFPVNEAWEDIPGQFKKLNSWAVHIMRRFMTEAEAVVPEVNSFGDFAKAIIKKLNGKTKGVKTRLRTRYGKNGFVEVYPYPAFIENMVDGVETKLKSDPKDLEKPVSTKMGGGYGQKQTQKEAVANDLPF